MAYPFDDSFDIYGLSAQNRLQQLMQDPYAGGLHAPGLMDSAQPQENPFHGLFNPNYNQSPSPQSMDEVPRPDVSPDPSQAPQNPMDEYIRLMREMYHPQTSATDRLNQLISSFPQDKKPSLGRTLVGVAAGLGGGYKASEEVMNEPRKMELENWKAQTGPAYQAAEVERQRNDAERTLTSNVISAKVAADKLIQSEAKSKREVAAKETIEARKAENEKQKNDINDFKARHPDWKMDTTGPTIITFDPATGQPHDTKISTKWMTELDKLHLQGQNAMNLQGSRNAGAANVAGINAGSRENVAGIQGATARDVAGIRQAAIGSIPDPNDPTKSIGVWYNPANNKMEKVTLDGQGVGPVTKPGTPNQTGSGNLTNTTRVMQEGAKMMLPSIPDIDNMAQELDKRGLFGPIMSRIRGYAAKVGTTGSPEEIEKSLNEFANAITTDPYINENTDSLVGEFATRLGLMASGAGRVHGGARGGGSIQMIDYMKGLFTSDSSLSMFQGRLKGLKKQLTDYAVGPGGVQTTTPKDNLDTILDNILKGKK